VTLDNTDGEIGGLTISDPPTQAEVQALRDQCEELAGDELARRRAVRSHGLQLRLLSTAASTSTQSWNPSAVWPGGVKSWRPVLT